MARGRSRRRGDGDVRRDRRHIHGTFLQSEGCREKSRCRTVSRRLPNRSALRASSPPIPAATVSTAGILPDCPEAVFPTVSTHGRGRLSVCRLSFIRLSVTPPLAPEVSGLCRARTLAESEKSSGVDFFLCGKSLQFCDKNVFFRESIVHQSTFAFRKRSAPTVTESARESVATRESVKFIPDYYSAYSNHHA